MSTKTIKNLEAAFAGESMANRKYLYFARVARSKGAEDVARLFEAVAAEETEHAFAHLAQLYPAENLSVDDVLRIAMEGELYETNQMYPQFEREAREEQSESAVAEFHEQARESREHAALFGKALDRAARTFAGLAKVERRHAARYAAARESLKAPKAA